MRILLRNTYYSYCIRRCLQLPYMRMSSSIKIANVVEMNLEELFSEGIN